MAPPAASVATSGARDDAKKTKMKKPVDATNYPARLARYLGDEAFLLASGAISGKDYAIEVEHTLDLIANDESLGAYGKIHALNTLRDGGLISAEQHASYKSKALGRAVAKDVALYVNMEWHSEEGVDPWAFLLDEKEQVDAQIDSQIRESDAIAARLAELDAADAEEERRKRDGPARPPPAKATEEEREKMAARRDAARESAAMNAPTPFPWDVDAAAVANTPRARLSTEGAGAEEDEEEDVPSARDSAAAAEKAAKEIDEYVRALEEKARSVLFLTLVPIRPRWRGESRSLRTFGSGVCFSPPTPRTLSIPDAPRRISTSTDAPFQLHPDVRRLARNDPKMDAPDATALGGYHGSAYVGLDGDGDGVGSGLFEKDAIVKQRAKEREEKEREEKEREEGGDEERKEVPESESAIPKAGEEDAAAVARGEAAKDDDGVPVRAVDEEKEKEKEEKPAKVNVPSNVGDRIVDDPVRDAKDDRGETPPSVIALGAAFIDASAEEDGGTSTADADAPADAAKKEPAPGRATMKARARDEADQASRMADSGQGVNAALFAASREASVGRTTTRGEGGGGGGLNAASFKERAPRGKALLVGANYFAAAAEKNPRLPRLRGSLNDVAAQMRFLRDAYGFKTDAGSMRVLIDEPLPGVNASSSSSSCCGASKRGERDGDAVPTALRSHYYRPPTTTNVKAGIEWLLEDARAGDVLFFHFSGHGTDVPDVDGDEDDGVDEALCTIDVDWETNFGITDDYLREKFFCAVPPGVDCFATFDCCCSGALSDAKAVRTTRGGSGGDGGDASSSAVVAAAKGAGANRFAPPPARVRERITQLARERRRDARKRHAEPDPGADAAPARPGPGLKKAESLLHAAAVKNHLVSLSSSKGDEPALEMKVEREDGVRRGAFTWALEQALRASHDAPESERNLVALTRRATFILRNAGKAQTPELHVKLEDGDDPHGVGWMTEQREAWELAMNERERAAEEERR